MRSPQDMQIILIDITNACTERCSNCTRFCGNHKKPFFMTYGDGVSDINIDDLLKYHIASQKKATLTATELIQRFGVLELDDKRNVHSFKEKAEDGTRINVVALTPNSFSEHPSIHTFSSATI